MTVKELYLRFSERIPEELSEEWDNDGLMCSADSSAEVRRALVTLDVTEEIVDYAIEQCFDLIVSHHPLIFRPIGEINEDNHTARKLIKLIESGISVFSFHTRADKVVGGVNDLLCDLIGMYDTRMLGTDLIGRVGELDEELSLEDFAYKVKIATGSDAVRYADGYNKVKRVAVVGGDITAVAHLFTDGQNQPLRQQLLVCKKGDQRGGHDLKIIQQRCIGRAGMLQTQHQQNGRCNIQQDHADGIGQLRPGQRLAFLLVPAKKAVDQKAKTGTQI